MYRNIRLTVAGFVTAALGLGGTLVAYLAEQQNTTLTVVAADSAWNGSTRTSYKNTTVSFNGGSYYVIQNANELAYVATDSASWTKNFLLANDIDLGSKNWTPIAPNLNGNTTNTFSGIFDFNGHIVSNLSITGTYKPANRTTWSLLNLGLFGNNEGAIRNLNLKDPKINVTCGNYRNYVGAIAGYNDGLIESVTLSNLSETVAFTSVKGANIFSSYDNAVGAMVGLNDGTVKNALYLSGSASVTSSIKKQFWDSSEINAGTIYGSGYYGTTTNVYTDTTHTTATVASNVSNNTENSNGDLANLTKSEAVTTINDDITSSSGNEAALPVVAVDDNTILVGGTAPVPDGSSSSSSTPKDATPNEATDLLVNFLLLDTCQDCDRVEPYWDAYTRENTTKNRFDAYTINDNANSASYSAGQRLRYMHGYAASKGKASGLNVGGLGIESSEGSALLLVGGVMVALISAGYILIKKKVIA